MQNNFKYLDELIHSGAKEIVLDSDIVLGFDEESEYLDGIKLDVDDVTIEGNGFAVDAKGKTRIFSCTGKNITIKNIILKNGYASRDGGAIYNLGCELTITKSTLTENTAENDGGSIYNWCGSLTITESTFNNNTAENGGGSIYIRYGGLTITESTFNNNTAENGGGSIYSWCGSLTITESTFNNNAAYSGGAIFNGRDLIISKSSFNSNMAKGRGGAFVSLNEENLKLINCVFKNNQENILELEQYEDNFKNILYRYIDDLRIKKKIEKCVWEIYGNAMQDELIKDIDDRLIIAACLYVACRKNKEPYDMEDIADATHIELRKLSRAVRIIITRLNLKIEPHSPLLYIPRFSSELELSQKAQSKAIEIAEGGIENGIVLGKNPKGVAAAAIYLACESVGEKIEQRKISDIIGITEVTIRLRCKDLSSLVK